MSAYRNILNLLVFLKSLAEFTANGEFSRQGGLRSKSSG